MATINGLRYIRNADFNVAFNWYDATVGFPKLNAAGSPGTLSVTLSKDGAAYGALSGGGVSNISQELGTVALLAADTGFRRGRLKIVGTTALSPQVVELLTEDCLESGIMEGADNVDQTTTKVYLRSGASAVDNIYQLKLLEIVDGQDAVSDVNIGQKRIIIGYDGTDKFCTLLTPFPAACDDICVYKINELTLGEAVLQLQYEAGCKFGTASGTPSTTAITTSLTGLGTNALVNSALMLVSGVNAGLIRQVTGYNSGTGAFVTDAFPAAPSAGDLVLAFGSFG